MDLPGAADDDRQAVRPEQLLAVGGRGLDGLANGPLHARKNGGRGRGLCGRLIDGAAIAIDGRQRYIAALWLWHAFFWVFRLISDLFVNRLVIFRLCSNFLFKYLAWCALFFIYFIYSFLIVRTECSTVHASVGVWVRFCFQVFYKQCFWFISADVCNIIAGRQTDKYNGHFVDIQIFICLFLFFFFFRQQQRSSGITTSQNINHIKKTKKIKL